MAGLSVKLLEHALEGADDADLFRNLPRVLRRDAARARAREDRGDLRDRRVPARRSLVAQPRGRGSVAHALVGALAKLHHLEQEPLWQRPCLDLGRAAKLEQRLRPLDRVGEHAHRIVHACAFIDRACGIGMRDRGTTHPGGP